MSSLYFQKSESNTQNTEDDASHSDQEHPETLASILLAAGTQLPFIGPDKLSFDKILGRGSSFKVNREIFKETPDTRYPYYVAVKYIIPVESTPSYLEGNYDSVARELRVLTHPSLKDTHSILPVLGYGWTRTAFIERPYLVVDYSDHGTLSDYLKRIRTTLWERREFALDVAAGLKALHDCRVIHGDLKPANILVFDTLDNYDRPQMAKLADFGGSIFGDNNSNQVAYGGTTRYNAPEQEGRHPFKAADWRRTQHYYLADMYSFGITLWEIMKAGRPYMESWWFMIDESEEDFWGRSCIEGNLILQHALTFVNMVFDGNEPESVRNAVIQTFRLTLQNEPLQRANIDEVMRILAQGTA